MGVYALIQPFPALVHCEIQVDLGTLLEGPGIRCESDRLILLMAQFHQHKIRPALAKIAKKHQAHPVKQRHGLEPDNRPGVLTEPVGDDQRVGKSQKQGVAHPAFGQVGGLSGRL